jgi:hypothetical protein
MSDAGFSFETATSLGGVEPAEAALIDERTPAMFSQSSLARAALTFIPE